MKPSVVIESLRLTYDTLYMNAQFEVMLAGAYPDTDDDVKKDLTRFLFDGFSFNHVMRWQPHKDWYIKEIQEFLKLFTETFMERNILVFGYAMVDDFLKQMASYTVLMLKNDPPRKDEWPYWFLITYLRPAVNS